MLCNLNVAAEVERFAVAFERARAKAGNAPLEEFLPPHEHPAYADIGLELLRIDLELTYQKNQAPSLHEYRRRFPIILASQPRFERLAFEDYRQRMEMALPATPG